MKSRYIDETIDYKGRELRPLWLYERLGLEGDAIAAFTGSCSVKGRDLVDIEDFKLGKTVAGERMLHFIAEIFGLGMPGIVFAQRLLCAAAVRVINRLACGEHIERRGDDLWVAEGKLSVSVATVSPVSGLIHMGLNITAAGVPVRAACLDDLGVDARDAADGILADFTAEVDGCRRAASKVRPVT